MAFQEMLKWLNVDGFTLNKTLYLEIGPPSERITMIAYNYSPEYSISTGVPK